MHDNRGTEPIFGFLPQAVSRGCGCSRARYQGTNVLPRERATPGAECAARVPATDSDAAIWEPGRHGAARLPRMGGRATPCRMASAVSGMDRDLCRGALFLLLCHRLLSVSRLGHCVLREGIEHASGSIEDQERAGARIAGTKCC